MKECQKLVMLLLNSILVLWRKIHVLETDDADDDLVIGEINKLKQYDSREYE